MLDFNPKPEAMSAFRKMYNDISVKPLGSIGNHEGDIHATWVKPSRSSVGQMHITTALNCPPPYQDIQFPNHDFLPKSFR